MITKFFSCTLQTDIVINASLATEGNMKTLDYIPGSNFMGIVAKSYGHLKAENIAFDIFHSGTVSFGDAHISTGGNYSYTIPFSLFGDKLNKELTGENAKIWVHHILEKNDIKTKNKELEKIQFKQHRSGYLNVAGQYIPKIEKKFALKSAQDRTARKSKDKAMFGFESIKKGQVFLFSVKFKNADFEKQVTKELIGNQRIGKSRSAQYGQVFIKALESAPNVFEHKPCLDKQLIIYAESNLCLFNEYGQSTFLPTPQHFGLKEEEGEINWAASQIRTYSYSPWNAYRNTSDPQRDCILKGSVIVFEFKEKENARVPDNKMIGAYQSEGLGRVLYNPDLLKANPVSGLWNMKLTKYKPPENSSTPIEVTSPLGKFLLNKKQWADDKLAIGVAVQEFLTNEDEHKKPYKKLFSNVSSSQWGGIRNLAIKADSMDDLRLKLFGKDETIKNDNPGFLMNGIAAENIWDKQKGKLRKILLKELIKAKSKKLPPEYFAKLAAEITKLIQQEKKTTQTQ